MEWTIYNLLYLLTDTVKRENTSIILKVHAMFLMALGLSLKNISGQSYQVKIRTFGSSLVEDKWFWPNAQHG